MFWVLNYDFANVNVKFLFRLNYQITHITFMLMTAFVMLCQIATVAAFEIANTAQVLFTFCILKINFELINFLILVS